MQRPTESCSTSIRQPLPAIFEPPMMKSDRKSTRLNSSHRTISYAVFCLKKKKKNKDNAKLEIDTPDHAHRLLLAVDTGTTSPTRIRTTPHVQALHQAKRQQNQANTTVRC